MGDRLARLVHEQFTKCRFKIPSGQWTVLAGIAVERGPEEPEVVAFGAGLKCLPLESYSGSALNEMLVHDCHGEVLARRAFLAFILHQIKDAETLGSDCVLERTGDKWRLKAGLSLHMYVSHAPCGDASMPTLINKSEEDSLHTEAKRQKYADSKSSSIRRGRDDFSASLGTLRTKPGRSDAPYSACMSCSDKIASWTVLGLQGALLMHVLDEPLHLQSITVGDGFDEDALQRAINTRMNFSSQSQPMNILPSSEPFDFAKQDDREPCPESHVWFKGCHKAETLVKGRKKGSAPPKQDSIPKTSQSTLCKARLFEAFKDATRDQCESYTDAKVASSVYQDRKTALLEHPSMKGWIRGPRQTYIHSYMQHLNVQIE